MIWRVLDGVNRCQVGRGSPAAGLLRLLVDNPIQMTSLDGQGHAVFPVFLGAVPACRLIFGGRKRVSKTHRPPQDFVHVDSRCKALDPV